MELKEFLEYFYPNFKDKLKERIRIEREKLEYEGVKITGKDIATISYDYYREIFPEALKNFAKSICDKQAKNCND
jgi:hypothetical protein